MSDSAISRWLQRQWYQDRPPPALLRGLAQLMSAIVDDLAVKKRESGRTLPVPVLVVGNISVGGTGKTPFVIWLVEALRAQGWRPGIISRGYGGKAKRYPLRVTADTDPRACGDEPALLARRLGVPLAVAPSRFDAARLLLDDAEAAVNILVADDGLQHYQLKRTLEFCVIDGQRGIGNGWRLPAGPLREPVSRLSSVDAVIINGELLRPEQLLEELPARLNRYTMQLVQGEAVELVSGQRRPLAEFRGRPVMAMAGIGNPQRFFAALEAAGLTVQGHAFADHHRYQARDFAAFAGQTLLMTEKDAVKCAAFAQPGHWFVPVTARLVGSQDAAMRQWLAGRLAAFRIPAPGA